MSGLIPSLQNGGDADDLRMSSREIAEHTGKRHDHVVTDVEKMLEELELNAPKYRDIYLDSRNRKQKHYLLDKRLTLTLVSGYSVRLRMAIIDRWQELESEKAGATIKLPTHLETAKMLVTALEDNRKLLGQVEEMTPKAAFHDRVTASPTVCQMAVAAQVAKLPFGRNILFRKLRESGVLISSGNRHNLPKQIYIERGLFTVEESGGFEHPSTGQMVVTFTTHVTQKGIDWLIKNYGGEEIDGVTIVDNNSEEVPS